MTLHRGHVPSAMRSTSCGASAFSHSAYKCSRKYDTSTTWSHMVQVISMGQSLQKCKSRFSSVKVGSYRPQNWHVCSSASASSPLLRSGREQIVFSSWHSEPRRPCRSVPPTAQLSLVLVSLGYV
eukprot:CAMPEP_0180106840 /NCGR_PEP_ID=MMETSP0985-20121206/32921_1 /TAXON_ID=483367 /ORGANISM="non described non described, Strain CCMP 2436" /LENGTH=124 /DNA_ID=CAMNT_0022044219 /DNA_START=129 /DNA_END=503 /DNA_ORIENTATION=-